MTAVHISAHIRSCSTYRFQIKQKTPPLTLTPPPPTIFTTGAPTESAVSFSMVANVISEANEHATPTQLKGEEAETR